jgi:hypothetical protein
MICWAVVARVLRAAAVSLAFDSANNTDDARTMRRWVPSSTVVSVPSMLDTASTMSKTGAALMSSTGALSPASEDGTGTFELGCPPPRRFKYEVHRSLTEPFGGHGLLAGAMTVRYCERDETVEAGEASHLPPGHVARTSSPGALDPAAAIAAREQDGTTFRQHLRSVGGAIEE